MRRLSLIVGLVLLMATGPIFAQARTTWPSTPMLTGVLVTVSSAAMRPASVKRTFQASGFTTAGAGASTIIIEVSNLDPPGANDWVVAGTITLTLGTTPTSDGFVTDAPWTFVRARVSAISGTNAAVSVVMGSGS